MPRRNNGRCDECNGRGYFEEVSRKSCKNCNGEGSTRAAGHVASCGACSGQGEIVTRKRNDCDDCGGTGKTGGSKEEEQEEVAPQVVGKDLREAANNEASGGEPQEGQQVAPPAGGVPQAVADEESGEPRPRPKAKAKQRSKPKPKGPGMDFGSNGPVKGNIGWDEEAGVVLDLTLSPLCFCSSIGLIAAAIGLVLMARETIIWYLLGGAVALCGAGCLIKGNMQACQAAMETLKVGQSSAGGRG